MCNNYVTLIRRTTEVGVALGEGRFHLQVLNEHEGRENFPNFYEHFTSNICLV